MDKIIKILVRFYPVFLKGLGGTLWLAAATVLFGTVLGLVIAILRMSRIRVFNAVAGVYIEILRGTPILLQLYFFWLMLPKIMPFQMSDTAAILVALIINASAYISEIIRAGIAAVDPGQWEAARRSVQRVHRRGEGHVAGFGVLYPGAHHLVPHRAVYHLFVDTAAADRGHDLSVRHHGPLLGRAPHGKEAEGQ